MKYLLFLLILFSSVAFSDDLSVFPKTEVPALMPVVDLSLVLSESEKAILDQKIRELNSRGVMQMAILTIPTLNNEPIESYSMRVAEKWKLGTAKADNGLIFIIATNDHKIRIEVGQGLEKDITDVESSRVLREMKSDLKAGKYFAAFSLMIDRLEVLANYNSPENVEARRKEKEESDKIFNQNKNQAIFWCELIFLLVLIAVTSKNIYNSYEQTKKNKEFVSLFSAQIKLMQEEKVKIQTKTNETIKSTYAAKSLVSDEHLKIEEKLQKLSLEEEIINDLKEELKDQKAIIKKYG